MGPDTIQCAAEEEVLHGKWPAFGNQVLTELGLVVSQNAVFPGLVSPKVVLYSLDVMRDYLHKSVSVVSGFPAPLTCGLGQQNVGTVALRIMTLLAGLMVGSRGLIHG